MTCDMPTGTLNSMVRNGSDTNDWMMSGPNVEMPLDGTDMQKTMTNHSHVLTSRSASEKCVRRHSRDMTPIWLLRRRSIASTLSSSLRNLASVGESGIQKNMAPATATVMTPKKRNMICCG